jgi:hypothetical protein
MRIRNGKLFGSSGLKHPGSATLKKLYLTKLNLMPESSSPWKTFKVFLIHNMASVGIDKL